MSKLGLSNMILFQWFGVRLAKSVHPSGRTTWHIMRWVWPLTGWGADYRWICQVWPAPIDDQPML